MVKYIATKREGDVIVANFEEQKVSKATYGSGYDYSYTITEPGEWIVDGEKLFNVEEGDVVLKMYSVTNNWEEKEYIKISSPELKDYHCRRKENNKRRELEKPCENCVCCDKV
jgi:hypothetical protein